MASSINAKGKQYLLHNLDESMTSSPTSFPSRSINGIKDPRQAVHSQTKPSYPSYETFHYSVAPNAATQHFYPHNPPVSNQSVPIYNSNTVIKSLPATHPPLYTYANPPESTVYYVHQPPSNTSPVNTSVNHVTDGRSNGLENSNEISQAMNDDWRGKEGSNEMGKRNVSSVTGEGDSARDDTELDKTIKIVKEHIKHNEDNSKASGIDKNTEQKMAKHVNSFYVGCKKEGCSGVIAVPKNATHGLGFSCPLCMNKQRFCKDCEAIYINFRRHKRRGHELYEFQRKKQILVRNANGLFVPGKRQESDEEDDNCKDVDGKNDEGEQASDIKLVKKNESGDAFSVNVGNTEIERNEQTRKTLSNNGVHTISEMNVSKQDKVNGSLHTYNINGELNQSEDRISEITSGVEEEKNFHEKNEPHPKSQRDESLNAFNAENSNSLKSKKEENGEAAIATAGTESLTKKETDFQVLKRKGRSRYKHRKRNDSAHMEMLHTQQKLVLESKIKMERASEVLIEKRDTIRNQTKKMRDIATKFLQMHQKVPGLLAKHEIDWLETIAKVKDLSSDRVTGDQKVTDSSETPPDIDTTEYPSTKVSSINRAPDSLGNSSTTVVDGNKHVPMIIDNSKVPPIPQNGYVPTSTVDPSMSSMVKSPYLVAQSPSQLYGDQSQLLSSQATYLNIPPQPTQLLPYSQQVLPLQTINTIPQRNRENSFGGATGQAIHFPVPQKVTSVHSIPHVYPGSSQNAMKNSHL